MSISKQIGWSNEANLLYEILKELKRNQAITSSSASTIVTAVTSGTTSVVEVPTVQFLSASTTIAKGARSVTIVTDSSFEGTILGAAANPNAVYTFSAQAGNTLEAISIVRTAGSFTVLETK